MTSAATGLYGIHRKSPNMLTVATTTATPRAQSARWRSATPAAMAATPSARWAHPHFEPSEPRKYPFAVVKSPSLNSAPNPCSEVEDAHDDEEHRGERGRRDAPVGVVRARGHTARVDLLGHGPVLPWHAGARGVRVSGHHCSTRTTHLASPIPDDGGCRGAG